MKVLYITNGINGSGGLERVLSVKASILAENYGYEVSILVLNDGAKDPFYNFSPKIRIHSIDVNGNPLQYMLKYKNGIRSVVAESKPNIISVCDDGLKGFFIPKILNYDCKMIYERHASIELGGRSIMNKMVQMIMKSQVKNFARFVVLTRSNVEEWNGAKNTNIIVIPNPLSFESVEKSSLRNKNVIAVGTHNYNKGYDMLLEIWSNIEKVYTDWKLEIYGKQDQNKISEKLSEDLNLKNVHFFEPVSDIQNKYKDSSVMVMTSRSEGFGMVLVEAMECGVPCIAFDCPSGPRDIIDDKEDGILVPLYDNLGFTSSLTQLISNFELRSRLGTQAKKNVKRFSQDSIVKQWDGLFKNL